MVHFNYNIGDKIKLSKPVGWANQTSLSNKGFNPEKVYEIDAYGWKDTGNGYVPFYRVHAYCDEYLPYHNKLSEQEFIPFSETHSFDLDTDFYSTDGSLINIGDNVYYKLYWNDSEANCRFTFTGYGPVVELSFFHEKDKPYNEKRVTYRREFLCKKENGQDWLDDRRHGDKHTEFSSQITKVVPDEYAEIYVETLFKHRESYLLGNQKNCWYFEIKSWLEHIGIFDKVIELYNERKG